MRLPIATNSVLFLCAAPPIPVVDFESRRPRADENGEPLHVTQLVGLFPDGAEVIKVQLSGRAPELAQGQSVRVEGLVANYWQMGERSGVSFRADAVAGVPVQKTVAVS